MLHFFIQFMQLEFTRFAVDKRFLLKVNSSFQKHCIPEIAIILESSLGCHVNNKNVLRLLLRYTENSIPQKVHK